MNIHFLSASRRRQCGMAMLEVTSGILLTGAAATVVLSQQAEQESFALATMVESTAAALQSAVQLHQVKHALSTEGAAKGLVYTLDGILMGVDDIPAASAADCDAVWSALMVVQPQMGDEAQRFWGAYPNEMRCEFRYHHHKLAPVSVFYHTQTGEVAFE